MATKLKRLQMYVCQRKCCKIHPVVADIWKKIRFLLSRHLDAVLHGYSFGCNGVQLVHIHTSINLSNCTAWLLSFGVTWNVSSYWLVWNHCQRLWEEMVLLRLIEWFGVA